MSTQNVEFPTPGGHNARGEWTAPMGASGKSPAVVLIQEWWGINGHIRSLLQRLADAGFVALAPDLYHGKVAANAEEAGKMMNGLDWGRAIDEIAGAVTFLKGHPNGNGNVGILGFCMGGALTFASATKIEGLSAVVPFYGIPDPANVDYTKVQAPIQAHFSKTDQWAKPESAEAVKTQLENAGKPMELFLYDADHAFVNDTRPEVYNPEAAKLAWDRAIEFLHKHVG